MYELTRWCIWFNVNIYSNKINNNNSNNNNNRLYHNIWAPLPGGLPPLHTTGGSHAPLGPCCTNDIMIPPAILSSSGLLPQRASSLLHHQPEDELGPAESSSSPALSNIHIGACLFCLSGQFVCALNITGSDDWWGHPGISSWNIYTINNSCGSPGYDLLPSLGCRASGGRLITYLSPKTRHKSSPATGSKGTDLES